MAVVVRDYQWQTRFPHLGIPCWGKSGLGGRKKLKVDWAMKVTVPKETVSWRSRTLGKRLPRLVTGPFALF
jgi:hypothetical protein